MYVYKATESEYKKELKVRGEKIEVLTKKGFKKLEGEKKVVARTFLGKSKDDKTDDKVIALVSKKCKVSKLNFFAKGYMETDNDGEYIKVMYNPIPLLILFIALLGCLGFFFFQTPEGRKWNPIIMDDSQGDIKENKDLPDASTEYITFPGFSTVKIKEGSSVIPLSNPAGNTVNFVYTITTESNQELVMERVYEKNTKDKILKEISDAYSKSQASYRNIEDNGQYFENVNTGEKSKVRYDYEIIDTGSTIQLVKHTKELVFFTKGIAPGKSVEWDALKYLSKTTEATFSVSTFDIEDNHPTTGTNIAVHIVVL